MREEEIEIKLGTLAHYVLRKWRSIIVFMIVFAVLANLYFVKKSSSEATVSVETESAESQIEKLKDTLTESERVQVERVYTMYAQSEDVYLENESYLENSLLMQLDFDALPTYLMSYQITKNGADEEVENIVSLYEQFLVDEDTSEKIADVLEQKCNKTFVRELITLTDYIGSENTVVGLPTDSTILNVWVYAQNKEQCQEIAGIINERMESYTSELQQTLGAYSIQKVSEQYYVSANNDLNDQKMNLVTSMNSAYTLMKNVSAGLTENQQKYFGLLMESLENGVSDNQTSDVQPTETAYISIRYILVGLFVGMFFAALLHASVYIISKTVKDTDELMAVTALPAFGTALSMGLVDKRNKLDKWIDSLFEKGQKAEDDNLLLERVCHEIELQAETKEVNHILLTSTISSDEIDSFTDTVKQKLVKMGMKAEKTESIISDSIEALNQLQAADAVVFVEQLMRSSRDDVRKEIELCRRYQVKTLGNIVLKNNNL